MNINYREYADADADGESVKKLLTDLIISESVFNETRLSNPPQEYGDSYLGRMLDYVSKNKGIILVAEDGNRIVGCGVGQIKTQSKDDLLEYKPLIIGYVSDLFVDKDYRHHGIGKKIMADLEKYFNQNNCDYVELAVSFKNLPAQKMYQSLGYQNHLVHMIKKIKN